MLRDRVLGLASRVDPVGLDPVAGERHDHPPAGAGGHEGPRAQSAEVVGEAGVEQGAGGAVVRERPDRERIERRQVTYSEPVDPSPAPARHVRAEGLRQPLHRSPEGPPRSER